MKRFKSILIVAAIFLSGLFIGAVVGGSAALVDVVSKTFRGGPQNVRRIFVQRAKHDLWLDEDQGHQFWQILSETGGELRDAVRPVRPQIDAVLTKSAERLRAVLRSDQRPKFDRLMKEAGARWQGAMWESAPQVPPVEPAPYP